ncbi:MAG: hypothetical protein PHR61_04660 [Candidatus Absconditabacteria bacterium]|nr:hypothetical protein [Candidatus Absconditabacteria bacterium]
MYNYVKKIIVGLFTFVLLGINISNTFAVRDVMDIMFQPAKGYEKVIDLGSTKNAVGNEVFKESTNVGFNDNFGNGCFVNNQHIEQSIIESQMDQVGFQGTEREFCENVLGGDYDINTLGGETQAPLIVRITKFLLRLTIVLSITMVLYNGILWVIESAKGGDVKDAKNNILYIVGGILLALSSVVIINIISSITLSSLNINDMPNQNINNNQ